jgi:hypothetical protein
MRSRRGEFERIVAVLREAETDGPWTASEILELLDEHGEEFESAHRVATVLGRYADAGEVDVIRGHPYRYRFDGEES